MGALEVQNVKRAINRYGTMPKNLRIDAYLESLRQSSSSSSHDTPLVSENIQQQSQQRDQTQLSSVIHDLPRENQETLQHRSLSPRQNNNLRNQSQMTRSNSSSGVVNTYQPPNSPRNRCAINRNKNNQDNNNINLRTFRTTNNSAFRTASPSRSVQPTLADLEFPPPPPLDLPPPPPPPPLSSSSSSSSSSAASVSSSSSASTTTDENQLPNYEQSFNKNDNTSVKLKNSPIACKKNKNKKSHDNNNKDDKDAEEDDKSNDVKTREPSVKEASSRFGVNLRRRDLQNDSINLIKYIDEKRSVFRPIKDSKYDGTCISSSSPVESPPPPPPPLPAMSTNNNDSNDTFNKKPGMKEMLELKLINEIRHNSTSDLKTTNNTNKKCKTSNVNNNSTSIPSSSLSSTTSTATTTTTTAAATTTQQLDPASQLLSELCENLNIDKKKNKKSIYNYGNEYAMLNLKTIEPPQEFNTNDKYTTSSSLCINKNDAVQLPSPITEMNIKLKKIDKTINRCNQLKDDTNNESTIIDFKSRLRKVDNTDKNDDKGNKKNDDSNDIIVSENDDNDDKRKSTGSISSLKKLWENKECTSGVSDNNNQQLSPKLNVRNFNKNNDNIDTGDDSPEDHIYSSTTRSLLLSSSSSSSNKNVNLPSTSSSSLTSSQSTVINDNNEKPIVPAKPIKNISTNNKLFTSTIYATPICDKKITPTTTTTTTTNDYDETILNKQQSNNSTVKIKKNDIIELSNAIDLTITNLKGNPTIVMTNWLQLSDKVGLLHGLLQNINNNDCGIGIPAHARFQYRDLTGRLELQGRQLRAAGTRNITENTRLLSDVQNTIKDVTNMVQR